MNYKQKLTTEILYYTGYQLGHTLDKLNLMVDDLDVKIDSSKHINEMIRSIEFYSNSASNMIKTNFEH